MAAWEVIVRPDRTVAGSDRRPSQSDLMAAPVWVHRLHGDGLPIKATAPREAVSSGSQHFIDRWSRVAIGY